MNDQWSRRKASMFIFLAALLIWGIIGTVYFN